MSRTSIVVMGMLLSPGAAGCGWLNESVPYSEPKGWDFGEDEDLYFVEDLEATEGLRVDEVRRGPCISGESAELFYVRIADDPGNATLTGDCGAGNPGADIDVIVLVRPDGTEYYTATVEEDADPAGGVCDTNDKDDISTVLGQPDACAKDLGCGCGDDGYPENYDCDCAGGDFKWVGYYSLNGGAIIVSFEEGAELLCGDVVTVYEMYNSEMAGSEEAFSVSYGDENFNWIEEGGYAAGNADVDVTWDW